MPREGAQIGFAVVLLRSVLPSRDAAPAEHLVHAGTRFAVHPMKQKGRFLLAVLGTALGAAAVFGANAWFASSSQVTPAPESRTADPTTPPPSPAPVVADPRTPEVARQPAPNAEARTAAEGPAVAQGLRGLVLDTDNRALAGVHIHLIESAANDPFALTVKRRYRHGAGALASTQSAADGTFAVGLPVVQDKVYEVCVVSPQHATVRLGGLKLLAGAWHDLGAITLVKGATVRGRVTVEGRDDIPVPQAVVTILTGTAFEDAALRSLSGLDRGLSTVVDQNGYYEVKHAPSRGVVQVAAVAPGFARVLRQNIQLTSELPIEINFGLPPGQSVSGRVTSQRDEPVAGAQLEVWPQQTAASPISGESGDDGRFEIMGLAAGTNRLHITAEGYENHDLRDVVSGSADLRIVLARRATLRVRVLTPERQVVRSYQLALRRFFAEQGGQIGHVADVPEQRVRLDGLTDFAELAGVPMGVFQCQVIAEGWAKTLSDAVKFEPTDGGVSGEQSIDVVLSAGVTLRGRVLDEAGAPLAGATVVTQADGATPDSPAWRMLASAVPERITAMRVTTDAEGNFLLPRLALASYQLEVDHEEACRTLVPGLHLDAPGEQTLPAIRLPAGATVTGRATVDGRIAGQMKVVLSSRLPAGTPPGTPLGAAAIRLEAVTDPDGAFVMPRRVPPGDYDLRAAVVGTATDTQIIQQLMQLQRSATTVTVAAGQRRVERDIDLPPLH